jgi:hypothetical protein
LFNEFFRSLFIRADKAGKMSWALQAAEKLPKRVTVCPQRIDL